VTVGGAGVAPNPSLPTANYEARVTAERMFEL
jgi:hypothetical protein